MAIGVVQSARRHASLLTPRRHPNKPTRSRAPVARTIARWEYSSNVYFTSTSTTPKIDLISAASYAKGQPHEQFRWLRENDPVHWHEQKSARGFWAVTRYQDVWAIGRDAKTYSSYAGGIMLDDPDEFSLQQSRSMMLHMDPPDHTRYRTLVSREFIPRSANALKPRVEELAKKIIDDVIERGECDLMPDIAGVLPSYVIADLMGIPLEDGRRLYALTEKMHSAHEAVNEQERDAAGMEMLSYALNLAEEKRKHPGNDIATKLLNSEIDGDRLTPAEYSFFFLLLVNAGGDTTRNLLGGGMLALFNIPISAAACSTTSMDCCRPRSRRCCAT